MDIKQGYKQTELGIIPEDWGVKQFASVFDMYPNNTYPRDCMNESYGTYQNIHYGDVLIKYPTILDCDKIAISYLNQNKIRGRQIQSGDIIIADTAEDETVGKCVEVSNVGSKKIYSGLHTFFCRPKYEFANGWLGYYINSKKYHDQLLPYITGIKVSSISRKSILETKILVPPTVEQQAIVKALGDIDGLIAALDRKIAKKRLIKQGTMQQLLTGKKRMSGFVGEWVETKLGDIANIYQPQTIAQEFFSIYGYNVYGANGVIGKYTKYNHTTNQVLVTCRGSSCGTVNFSIGLCWITGNAMVVNLDNSNNINKRFIYYLLSNSDLSDLVTGSGQPQIVRHSLIEYTITIPNSKQEQQVIANALSNMDKEIADLKDCCDKYKLIKNGMMQKLLTGEIRLIEKQPRVVSLEAHVVAGHVVYKLHESIGWGRTKLQKALHLINYHCQIGFGAEFIRNTAGPDDQYMLNCIDAKFRQYRHVEIQQEKFNGRIHYTYKPTAMIQEVECVYNNYPQEIRESIDNLLQVLDELDLGGAEIISTLYAVWNNRIIKQQAITDELLLGDFYAWSEHKADFAENRVRKALNYMKTINLVPTGWERYIDKR